MNCMKIYSGLPLGSSELEYLCYVFIIKKNVFKLIVEMLLADVEMGAQSVDLRLAYFSWIWKEIMGERFPLQIWSSGQSKFNLREFLILLVYAWSDAVEIWQLRGIYCAECIVGVNISEV